MATQIDLQPLLSGNSPNCNANFSEPSSPAAADVIYDFTLTQRPPAQVQANEALQIVALLTCDLAQQQNLFIAAFATLLSHTREELPDKLLGKTVEYGELVSLTTTKFCFNLAIPDSGKYHLRISLEKIGIGIYDDNASWLHVESEAITVTNNGGFLDNVYDRDLKEAKEARLLVPLPCREANDSEVTYDTSQVVVGGIRYDKRVELIPEFEIVGVETDLYDEPELHIGFYYYGEGLFRKDEKWYQLDENVKRSVIMEEDEVLDGNDGRKYRKGIRSFQQHYLGLKRAVVRIGTVRYIEHLILYDAEECWTELDVPLSVALSPDSTKVASASYDKTLRIWDTDKAQLLLTLDGHTDGVFSIAFSPDGTKMASASHDKTLRTWDTDTGALLLTIWGHTDGVFSVEFSPDGRKIASASHDKTLRMWDADTGALLAFLKVHTNGVFPVAFSPDGTMTALAFTDKTHIWDTDTGALLSTLDGHTDKVFSIAFSPDSTKIASVSSKTLNIRDVDMGIFLTLDSYGSVLPVFSPDSKLLALASHQAVWIWDYTKHTTPQMLLDNDGKLVEETETIKFSPDGSEVISVSLQMEIRRWNTKSGSLLSTVVI